MDTNTLSEQCFETLKANDHGSHTTPAPRLYPHQWLWDSCFAAIGWAQIDTERAKQEILSLLEGQWSNGMIPHMIFDNSPKYAQDRNLWRSWVSNNSPDHVATSGITQPPVIAEAVYRVGKQLKTVHKIAFYKKVIPHLIKYHQWLYGERDPHQEGLILQIHPYEVGFDNTPPWMNQLREHSLPWWISAIEKLKLNNVINLFRRDTKSIPSDQRIDNTEAVVCWDVIRRLRRKNYDIEKILYRSLFVIEDVAFNSIFIRNNIILRQLALEAKIRLPEDLVEQMKISEDAVEKLWDETYALYFSRDFMTNHLIKEPTVASLLPLYTGVIKKERAIKLVKILDNDRAFWLNHPIPTVPKNMHYFDQNRYWQGPTWININWLVIDGLERMGFLKEATSLKSHTIELVRDNGIWEYYNPINGHGLGSQHFSWTAALILDLLEQ